MKKLYQFGWYCGRMGNVEGLFIAEESDVQNSIGKEVYFGEILGKHSEVYGTLEEDDIEVKSDDQELINKLITIFGSLNISGYNPLEYIEEDEEE